MVPAAELKRHAAVYGALARTAEHTVPLTTVVELTRRCNLRCVMCYATPDRGRPELSDDALFGLIDQIRDLGSLFVTFIGGDPTVRGAFLPLVRHARSRRLAVQILTNGLLLDEAACDALAEARVMHVGLTLLGGTAATHDRLARRPGAFAGVLGAARLLKARGVHAVVKFLLMRDNAQELPEVERIAGELGAPLTVNPSITPTDRLAPGAWGRRLQWGPLAEAVRRFARKEPRTPSPDGSDLTCLMARGYMAVNAYGDVLACISLPVPAGNVRYAPLRTIWEESPFLLSMRRLNPLTDLHGCPDCRLRPTCHRCYGLAYTETGDLFGPQPGACLKALASAGEEPDPTAGGPPGLSHADSRYWSVGDILEPLGLSCQGA